MKVNWWDATKWSAAGGTIGALLGLVLSSGQIEQVLGLGQTAEIVLTCLLAAVSTALVALRKVRK